MKLTRTEHRIFQMFLHLGELTTAQIMEAIGRDRAARYPREYIWRMRRKIAAEGLLIDMVRTATGVYALRRTRPLRNRAEYMRSYRKAAKIKQRGASVAFSPSGEAVDRPARNPRQRPRLPPHGPLPI